MGCRKRPGRGTHKLRYIHRQARALFSTSCRRGRREESGRLEGLGWQRSPIASAAAAGYPHLGGRLCFAEFWRESCLGPVLDSDQGEATVYGDRSVARAGGMGQGSRRLRTEGLYPRNLAEWQEVHLPTAADRDAREVWSYAANHAQCEWRVFTEGGQPQAQLTTESPAQREYCPRFALSLRQAPEEWSYTEVDDGWLAGYNAGEFGGALRWFSPDGKQSYDISDHQVVAFFRLPDGLYAIDGLSHLCMSSGSIIRLTRPKSGARWQAVLVTGLPSTPCAISPQRDGATLVTLEHSLVSIGADWRIRTLLPTAPWGGWLYPNSSVLSPGEEHLYIGMRQFVGEFSLATGALRLLIPSAQFLNKLTAEEEEQIRNLFRRRSGC